MLHTYIYPPEVIVCFKVFTKKRISENWHLPLKHSSMMDSSGWKKKPKTMATAIKSDLWTCNIMTFLLAHIKFVISIRQETHIYKIPQKMVCKKSPFESDLKASVQLGNSQFLYFFLLKKTPPWPGRRSSLPPPPRCQRPSSSLLATISSLWRPWAWSLLVL